MKWTITMTQEELNRKTVIEQANDKRITQKEGAARLGTSERHFRRLLFRYRKQGDIGLVSQQRGKPGHRRLKEEKRKVIEEFIQEPRLEDFGPTLMAEKLEEYTGIQICKETMRQVMIEAGLHQARSRRFEKAHPERERRERRGELVQIDGSLHAWLEDRAPKACLILFVDDATSEVLAARFVDQESYFAYGTVCKTYFRSVGVPVAFYSDKFSVFKVNNPHLEAVTQFNRAITQLGIHLYCASSPQAKGRVERANETFQDRLVKELRLRNIHTYPEANAYLPEFLQFYNRKFAVLPRSTSDAHIPLDPSIDLDFLFSIHDTRIISKDLQIQVNHVTYQILTNRPARSLAKREVLITLDEAGKVTAYLNRQPLTLNVLVKQPKLFELVTTKSIDPQVYVPPSNHPWRTYGKKLNGLPVLIKE
jgi:transposase